MLPDKDLRNSLSHQHLHHISGPLAQDFPRLVIISCFSVKITVKNRCILPIFVVELLLFRIEIPFCCGEYP